MGTTKGIKFCAVCGSENQKIILTMPESCGYSRLGGCICLECCRECSFFDGCAEIRVLFDAFLAKKSVKVRPIGGILSRIKN